MHSTQFVLRGGTTLPVIEGALAFVVISFIAQTWPNIPSDKQYLAFVLIYGCGAHFIFSFFAAIPFLYIANKVNSTFFNLTLMLAMFAYVFWSLNEQHHALSALLIEPHWEIPLPFGEQLYDFLRSTLGSNSTALYFAPLLISYTVAIVLSIPSIIIDVVLSLFHPKTK